MAFDCGLVSECPGHDMNVYMMVARNLQHGSCQFAKASFKMTAVYEEFSARFHTFSEACG